MSDAKSGTLTFLFTDLEGSTRHWEECPEEMGAALARHDKLVHALIQARGGVIFAGMGDGVAASFERATDAARAALEIQAAINVEAWPDSLGSLRVRMGLHTGEAEARDGSYYGSAVNRAARVMAVAWGCQVVCTTATASLLVDDFELCDLGEHRLRDLSRAERIWQFGSAAFPPLRSGTTLPGNLPTQGTEFIGRQSELQDLRDAFDSTSIVTLTGVGGAGKTRLALQFAAGAQPRFRNGVWLCDLAPLTTPDAVGPLVAAVVGCEPSTDGRWVGAIVEGLRSRQLLLVLDNCEHVLDAAALVVDAVVKGCPEVAVVATSREGLGVAGERILPIGSLSVSRVDDRPDVARATDAVSLFVSRARDVRPLEADDAETITAIAHICRRLDGIPLAIELAAARTQSLSVVEIAQHLDDRFKLLTRGARTALGRHQTLRAAIDWSFDLLDHREQRVLARASVFAGGFTLDAAAAVCNPESTSTLETLDQVDGLVRRSMLIAEERATTTRYRMLETIRQYGAEQLEAGSDAAETSRAHLEWVSAFALHVGEQLRGPNDAAGLARLESEVDNIRTALQFAVEIGDLDAATTLLASAPIGTLWDSRFGGSMATLAREAADLLGEPDHPVSAALLSLLALDAALRFAGVEAVELAERACVVARRHDQSLRTGPWLACMLSSLIADRSQATLSLAQEAHARALADDDDFAVAEWTAQLGIAHWMSGDIEEAQHLTELGLTLADEIGADNLVMRNAFLHGVSLLTPEADPSAAFSHFRRAVQLGERVGGNVLYGGAAWAVLLADRGDEDLTAAALAHELAARLPTPMFLMSADNTLDFYNDAAATVIGKPFVDVGQIPGDEFGASLDLATVDGARLRRQDSPTGVALFQRRPAHQAILATGYDGIRRAYETSAFPLTGQGGEFAGVVTVFWERPSLGDHAS